MSGKVNSLRLGAENGAIGINSYGMSVAARQQINTKVKKTCHISGHSLYSGNSSDIIGEKCITNRNIEKITAKVKSMFRKSSKYMADQI